MASTENSVRLGIGLLYPILGHCYMKFYEGDPGRGFYPDPIDKINKPWGPQVETENGICVPVCMSFCEASCLSDALHNLTTLYGVGDASHNCCTLLNDARKKCRTKCAAKQ